MAIGKRISERRIQLGLSRMQLAHRLGVDTLCVYRWEKGRVWPSVRSVCALADELQASVDWVLRGRESRYRRRRKAAAKGLSKPASAA